MKQRIRIIGHTFRAVTNCRRQIQALHISSLHNDLLQKDRNYLHCTDEDTENSKINCFAQNRTDKKWQSQDSKPANPIYGYATLNQPYLV